MAGQIEALLAEAAAALDRRSSAFAIIGGIAISARVEPRFTRDLDLAVAVADDREAENLARDFQAAGFAVVTLIEQENTGRLATIRYQRRAFSARLGSAPAWRRPNSGCSFEPRSWMKTRHCPDRHPGEGRGPVLLL